MRTNLYTVCRSLLHRALHLSLPAAIVLLGPAAEAAQLRLARNQGNLELNWDDLNAKLQETLTLNGPWQTVNAAAVGRCVTRITGTQKFYRLVLPPAGKKWLTVAAVTMTSQTNVEANLRTMRAYMDQALTNAVDLVAFPEAALQQCPPWGYSSHTPTSQEMDSVRQTAETVPGPSTSNLVAKASELNLFVVFGLTEKDEAGHLYNTLVLLGPQGVLGKHQKHHLWGAPDGGNEDLIWQLGPDVPAVIESPLGKVGLLICIEAALGEDVRLANAGADFLVGGACIMTGAEGAWEEVTTGDAKRTSRWVVATDQVGPVGHLVTIGRSRVVDPLGRTICDTGAREGMAVCSTDLMISSNR